MARLGAYKNLYLCLVEWGRRAHGPQDLPEYNALLGLATLATMNLFSVVMLGELAFGKSDLVPNPKISALLLWIGLVVLHYAILLPVARSGRVAEATPVGGTRMRTVLVYAIGSFVVFLALLSVRMTTA
jgi:hypothetical protein